MSLHNKKVLIATGTRAEYGLLRPLIRRLDSTADVILLVTGTHLSPEFGYTLQEIEADGFEHLEKVEILMSSDSSVGVVKSMGLGLISFGEVFERIQPNLIILLGDRYEMLSVASAAIIMKIPIAHLHGGELTEDSFDESIRHAITKMSHLHFTSTEEYRRRVIQLGEQPKRVFNVGAIGLDNIKYTELLNKDGLEKELKIKLNKRIFLITYHPVTLEEYPLKKQVDNLLAALEIFDDATFILTKANADPSGRYINDKLALWVENRKNAHLFDSLGSRRYLSMLCAADVVIGNSSSGIIEAPGLGTVTVNIGDRQKGRVRADSIIDCSYSRDEIVRSIKKALSKEMIQVLAKSENPYGEGNTSENIIRILNTVDFPSILTKKFYDWK